MHSHFLAAAVLLLVNHAIGQEWNYDTLGPDVWGDFYPMCAQHSQSPINIRTACTVHQSFTPFQFASAYSRAQTLKLHNNGHTIIARFASNDSSPLLLTGGGLNGTYRFLNFHLHWGENYKSGSEHQVNGRMYAGEAHFVHIQPETNKIAVLGMFMESVPNGTVSSAATTYPTTNLTSQEWRKYFSVSQYLGEVNNTVTLSLNLSALMGIYLNDFWRYEGSFTTPPCTEGITWTMFRAPLIFTESTIGSFRRNVYFEDYRGPQPLYNRVVQRSFPDEIISSIPDFACCEKRSSDSAENLAKRSFSSSSIIIFFFYTIFQFSTRA